MNRSAILRKTIKSVNLNHGWETKKLGKTYHQLPAEIWIFAAIRTKQKSQRGLFKWRNHPISPCCFILTSSDAGYLTISKENELASEASSKRRTNSSRGVFGGWLRRRKKWVDQVRSWALRIHYKCGNWLAEHSSNSRSATLYYLTSKQPPF